MKKIIFTWLILSIVITVPAIIRLTAMEKDIAVLIIMAFVVPFMVATVILAFSKNARQLIFDQWMEKPSKWLESKFEKLDKRFEKKLKNPWYMIKFYFLCIAVFLFISLFSLYHIISGIKQEVITIYPLYIFFFFISAPGFLGLSIRTIIDIIKIKKGTDI